MEHLVKIEKLQKTYGNFRLSLDRLVVEPGSVVGLVGSNGAGKTSTIKALLGVIRPEAGTVELFGCPVGDTQAFAEAKSRIGVVFDTCPFPPDLTVEDVSRMGRAVYARWDEGAFNDLALQFGLDPKKRVNDLSRGMGMKLQIAFALAHDPDLLILDEVTAGLDPIARVEVLDLLRSRMNESRGVLISTHITSDLEKIADHVCCIDAGEIVFSQDIDAICDQAGVLSCREAELEEVCNSGIFEKDSIRTLKEPLGMKALVPDRLALAKAFPDLACERASVEAYMTLMLKGGKR